MHGAQDAPRAIFGRDGRVDTVGAYGAVHRGGLSEAGPWSVAPGDEVVRARCGVWLFYNPSAPGVEDLLNEVESVRRFVGWRLTGSLPERRRW